jgi:hypothetical protein
MASTIKYEASARRTDRKEAETQVTCRMYTSSKANRAVCGVLRNFSTKGAYIESAYPFKIGTVLQLKLDPKPGKALCADAGELPLPFCLMEVKWCHLLEDEYQQRFGVGLRHLEPFT